MLIRIPYHAFDSQCVTGPGKDWLIETTWFFRTYNAPQAGKLFRDAGLHLTWFAARPRFKPSEYRKLTRPGLREHLALYHPRVLKHWLTARRFRSQSSAARP